jgi:Ca-activated chloride channel family protein
VRPQEDVERKVAQLYEKVRYPVLTDLRFRMEGVRSSEVLPTAVPDLFRGGQVILSGRYDRGGRTEVVLSGDDGAVRREFHYVLATGEPGTGLTSDFPARVWATRRIGELVDQIRLKKRADPELVEEIVRLSTRFGILTEYTAFLADETYDMGLVSRTRELAQRSVDLLADKEVGGAGFAQSWNNGFRRGAERPAANEGQTLAFGDESDRAVLEQSIGGVRQVANRAFYRKTLGWIDANVKDATRIDETVVRWSPRFFEMIQSTSPDENGRLSQPGPLVLEIQGRVVRIVEPG